MLVGMPLTGAARVWMMPSRAVEYRVELRVLQGTVARLLNCDQIASSLLGCGTREIGTVLRTRLSNVSLGASGPRDGTVPETRLSLPGAGWSVEKAGRIRSSFLVGLIRPVSLCASPESVARWAVKPQLLLL
jgi:hypothetical protein